MKTRVYIDGANFYFGLLKNHPEWKWLDLKGFVSLLVRSDHEINAIQYFTSYIKTHPYDHAATERQNVYLQGIEAFGGVEIVFGKYNKNKAYLPPVEDKCLSCDATRNGLIRVMKFEEKRTDVNLATCPPSASFTTRSPSARTATSSPVPQRGGSPAKHLPRRPPGKRRLAASALVNDNGEAESFPLQKEKSPRAANVAVDRATTPVPRKERSRAKGDCGVGSAATVVAASPFGLFSRVAQATCVP